MNSQRDTAARFHNVEHIFYIVFTQPTWRIVRKTCFKENPSDLHLLEVSESWVFTELIADLNM